MDIAGIITSVGFPTLMCILMYNMCNTTLRDIEKSVDKLTVAITKLTEKEEKEE